MRTQLRILLLEDSEDDALLLLRELRRAGYQPIFERVDTLEGFEAALNARAWDVITADYAMPCFNGLAALSFLQKKEIDIPFIIVSGQIGEELAVEAMRNGARDYILKNNLKRLVPIIEREIREAKIRRQQRQAEEDLYFERKRLGEMANHVNCALLLLDDDARVIYANCLASEWFGPSDQLKGRHCWDILDLTDPKREYAILQLLYRGNSVEGDISIRTTRGEKKYVHISATPVRDNDQTLRQLTVMLIDITERKQVEHLNKTLNDVNAIISSTFDFEKVGQQVVTEALKAIGCDTVVMGLRENGEWVIKHMAGFPFINTGDRFSDETARTVAFSLEIRQPVVINDVANDTRVDSTVAESFGLRSFLICPMVAREEIIGALGFAYCTAPAHFTKAQIDFGGKLAVAVSLALENSRLFAAQLKAQKEAEAELEISNLLLKAADMLALSLDLDEILNSFADIVLEVTGRNRVFVNQVDMKTGELMVMISRGGMPVPPGTKLKFDELSPEFQQAVSKKRTIVLDYEEPGLSEVAKNMAEATNTKLVLYTPLLLRDRIIGHMAIDEAGERREFTQRDIDICEGIAAQASTAIEKARLYSDERQAKTMSDALNEIGIAVTSTLNFDEIKRLVVRESVNAIGCESAAIGIREGNEWVIRYVHGLPVNFVGHRFSRSEIPLGAFTALNRMPIVINDVYNDPRIDRRFIDEYGIRSTLLAPLVIRGGVAGGIFFNYHSEPLGFTRQQIDFTTKLAASVSLALENAHLYEAEHMIAETLQEALLALPQEIPGVDFGHFYRSATDMARVGGDFYEVFNLGSDKVGLLIGDVSGKGIAAAGLTSLVKNSIKAYAFQGDMPAVAIEKTNKLLGRAVCQATFVTVFFGILDTMCGGLSCCSAGHPSPIIKQKASVYSMPAAGLLPIGISNSQTYSQQQLTVDRDDTLILYTDGITEARRGREFFGEERLIKVVRQLEYLSPGEMAKAILNETLSFTGGPLADDVALLALSLSKDVSYQ